MKRTVNLAIVVILLMVGSGCSSQGRVGILSRPFSLEADAGALLQNGRAFDELGSVQGQACRHLILVAIPWGGGSFGWGTATISYALQEALDAKGGDALLNVKITTSLYNFLIYAFTCTTVEGTAIRFHSR
ncbi:MAG TPA: hypothetical protein VJU82_09685 [Acidobacteriaceae bacterium]|nr:hypothetical protein [Acidobacteriaceae bacterium]